MSADLSADSDDGLIAPLLVDHAVMPPYFSADDLYELLEFVCLDGDL